MKNHIVGVFAALSLGVAGQSSIASKPVPKRIAVWPREGQSIAPISLSRLIALAIPKGNRLGWDHLQTPNVRWLSEGIEYSETGVSTRLGIARVRAGGAKARLLRQSWEELAWSIELSTDGNPKWGPTSVRIQPGFSNARFKGNYICFGTGFEGCSFDLSAIRDPQLRLKKVCEIGSGSGESIVMTGTTIDGRSSTVVYSGSGGSGGWSNSVEITIMPASEYCSVNKNRGY